MSHRTAPLQARISSRLALLCTTALAAGLLVLAVPAAAQATPASHADVAFCHFTSANAGHQYNFVRTSAASVVTAGHGGHRDDIIPAFDYTDRSGTVQHFSGLNLDRLGWIHTGSRTCAAPPAQPADQVRHASTEGTVDCDTATVPVTTTTTTTPYVYDESSNTWVLDSDHATTNVEHGTRAATDAELSQADCQVVPPRPDPVVQQEAVDGVVDCDTATVPVTTTTTTTDWVWDTETEAWVTGTPETSVEHGSRTATDAELSQAGCEVPPPATDVCPDLDGDQSSVPDGYVLDGGRCVVEDVLGTETTVSGGQGGGPQGGGHAGDLVLGTDASVPTAVDAGLGSAPNASLTQGSRGAVGDVLTAGGLLVLLVSGAVTWSRRRRSVSRR